MEYDIEIHTRNSGEKIVSVGIGGRMVAMSALEWLQLCEQVVTEINRHGQPRLTQRAPDALRCTSNNGEHYYLTYEKCVFCQHERG